MLGRTVSGIMIMLLSTSVLTLVLNVKPIGASGTIYIRADGTIDPPTAPIFTVDNVTYTFTDNIYDSIVVERSNMIIDGRRYALQGSGIGDGFSLTSINNVTIRSTNINSFVYGIRLRYSSCNTISGNNITANYADGIRLDSSSNNLISGNNITNNVNGIGLFPHSTTYNTIYGNNITANYCFGIWTEYSSYNTIFGNNITNNGYGVWFYACFFNTVFHNNFMNNVVLQAANPESKNIWDDSYPSGGNYWSDYNGPDQYGGPYQNESGSDGIGDIPYIIDGANEDRYPLMNTWLHVPGHDIAVISVTSKTVVGQGYSLNINVTVVNYGAYTETFNVTIYANDTLIKQQTIALTNGTFTTLTFAWNTAGFAKGNYTLSAYAWPVPDETYTGDNTLVDGWVFISIPGDINADRKVDLKDVFAVGKAFGSVIGGPRYNPNCDINNDGKIDLKDYFTTCKNFGKSW